MNKYLAPSLLSADFYNLESQLNILKQNDIKYLHLDVMDGIFVPNISFGIPVIKKLKDKVKDDFIFDTHLMIERPERYIEKFKKCGADILTIHCEATKDYIDVLSVIKSFGIKAGITLNPSTKIETIKDSLKIADLVLVMSVNPGFGGQKFISDTLSKVSYLKRERESEGYKYLIEIDGGINLENAKLVLDHGVDILVSGSSVFSGDINNNIISFNKILEA